jgi:hypothetical protein
MAELLPSGNFRLGPERIGSGSTVDFWSLACRPKIREKLSGFWLEKCEREYMRLDDPETPMPQNAAYNGLLIQ